MEVHSSASRGADSDKAECVAILNKVINDKIILEVHNSAGVQSSGRIKYEEYVSVTKKITYKDQRLKQD